MKYSVVIPAYNEEMSIESSLNALVRQDFSEPFEVIIVDNNSTDNTVSIARSYVNKLILRIVQEHIRGRGAARKAGFAAAKGDIIFSTDADTIVPVNWMSRFSRMLKKKHIVAVTGPTRVNDLGFGRNMLFNILQPAIMHFYRVFFGHYWLSGFSFAIRADIYRASGGFDARVNTIEDIELGFKVAKLGKIKYIRSPVLFSGRRFKASAFRGLLMYGKVFFLQIIQGRKDIIVDDPR
jgi:poly-beta-1,6-N-acetyl-D-glucosamine synthase